MTPNPESDFTQFTGAFENPVAANADFTARMQTLLANAPTPAQSAQSSVLVSPAKSRTVSPAPGRRSHPITIAASVIVVFAVLVASVWVLNGDMLLGEYGSVQSGIATLPANEEITPGPNVHLEAHQVPGVEPDENLVEVVGNLIITLRWQEPRIGNDKVGPSSAVITVRDIKTGAPLWQRDDLSAEQFSVAGDNAITFRYEYDESGSVSERFVVMLSVRTGDTLWQSKVETPAANVMLKYGLSPMIFDEVVVVADPDGSITALDLSTGDIAWESTFNPGGGEQFESTNFGNNEQHMVLRTVLATAWNTKIVLLNGDGLLQVVNSQSGELLVSHELAPDDGRPFHIGQIQMTAGQSGVILNQGVPSNGFSSRISMIDPVSGEILWQRDIEGQAWINVGDGDSIALNAHIWKEHPALLRFFGMAGYSTFQFHWIDVNSGKDILTTERGRLDTSQVTLTDGTYACTRTKEQEIVCLDQNGTTLRIDIEPQGDPLLVERVLYIPTNEGLFTVQLP